ncbi:MAG: methyl-accepting chemotaxis protein [bacterium]
MQWFKNLKIAGKINLITCSIVVIALFILSTVLLDNISVKSTKRAEDFAKKEALIGAQDVLKKFEITKSELSKIRDTVQFASETHSISREQIINLLHKYISNTPDVLGFYTLWEPNKFDGIDASYINRKGYDGTGRLIPYLVRSGNEIKLEPLVDYEKEGAGDYYLLPKKTKLLTLTEPYFYKIEGKDVLMASLTMPILNKNGDFLGIVGADIKLDKLQALVEKTKPMGGYAALLSGKGIFVAHGADPSVIMQSGSKYGLKSVIEQTIQGKEVKEYNYSKIYKGDVYRVFSPIHLEGTNTYWSFVSVLPKNYILADFYFYLNLILWGVFLAILLLVFANIYFVNRTINPINLVVKALDEVSKGNLKVNIDESTLSRDEAGKLGSALNFTVKNLRELVGAVAQSTEDISASSEDNELIF